MILSNSEVDYYGRLFDNLPKIAKEKMTFESFLMARLAGMDRDNRVRLDRIDVIKLTK
jgi:hypothetical protein